MKYTAQEILEIAGVENPAEVIRTKRTIISGIPVNKPDHLINFGNETKVKVVVGLEAAEVDLPGREEASDAVKAVLKAKGEASAKSFEEQQAKKGIGDSHLEKEET